MYTKISQHIIVYVNDNTLSQKTKPCMQQLIIIIITGGGHGGKIYNLIIHSRIKVATWSSEVCDHNNRRKLKID